MSNTVDPKEIQQFSKDSSHWWDENGPFKPLHRLNPVRLGYIKGQICTHFDRDTESLKPFEGLRILDIGCGGGLVCEPLARLGADVTGADADANAIAVAQEHAQSMGLEIEYYCGAAEDLASPPLTPPLAGGETPQESGGKFDVVLALEIIEHVADPAAFVDSIHALVKPGGLAIFSTLNRNPKSFLLGIVAAEYLLRWVPRGTHRWAKFLRPCELAKLARPTGFEPYDITGLVFDPLKNSFALSKADLDVNYLMTFRKSF